MKLHYSKILLFALPLNILAHNNKNKQSITLHTTHTRTTRLLCECELYAPVNYDNDPQMKEVMDNFNKQTQERFHEYKERLQSKRKQCKEQCDKEIQKIILKDKLEKELMDKFVTLHTDIQSDAIPTCVCEKSIAHKVEKGCLRCAGVFGGGIAPSVGLLGGMGIYGWETAVTAAAIEYATKKGIEAGVKTVIAQMKSVPSLRTMSSIVWSKFIDGTNYNTVSGVTEAAKAAIKSNGETCTFKVKPISMACDAIYNKSQENLGPVVAHGKEATASTTENVKKVALERIDTAFLNTTNAITASVVALLIIVLLMIIIYLVLRYRRKKKMNKKLNTQIY
ncbi:rifin PIR protein, putative [Plasmodium reichenowi]|uniref:Rifin PIR protein, putative n=1 Tax=Plasmodium reichenowi TaxID=5854 RepID=A0A2P9DE91_PLARE|nr:rifin PIR protein, putative [Plasmodium reichenowi]